MHNHDIIFDNINKRIGLVKSECSKDNGFGNDQQYSYLPVNNSNILNYEKDIRYYRILCVLTTICILVLIVFFSYAVRKLRRGEKFLWITLNDDSGKIKIFLNKKFYLRYEYKK